MLKNISFTLIRCNYVMSNYPWYKMRKGPKWMTGSDDSILEVLQETDCALSMKGIEVNSELLGSRIPYPTIQRRIPKLVQSGLLKQVDKYGTWYTITEEGSAYLSGDYIPQELDE